MDKKNILTYEGLKKLEDELQNLKVVKRKEVAQKIKEAREQDSPPVIYLSIAGLKKAFCLVGLFM